MKFSLPELPYAQDALAPVISAETISFHYGKHHQAYVNNLNNLIPGTDFEQADLDTIVKKPKGLFSIMLLKSGITTFISFRLLLKKVLLPMQL